MTQKSEVLTITYISVSFCFFLSLPSKSARSDSVLHVAFAELCVPDFYTPIPIAWLCIVYAADPL